ncbi:MAG: hypothetical protein CMH83_08560 [Nocardioides sp.]|nr:hypothetical protein [Nocardioides sp.]
MARDAEQDESQAGPDLLAEADRLYALPLGEFTPARDARAKELKGTDLAPEVKRLRKPSLAAWVVNLLARREGDRVQQVLDVGAALRAAQEGMDAGELRALTRQRRQLTAAVTQQARSLAREAGVKVTEAVAGQVEATLTAAMISEDCARAVRSGLLVAALETTGVDDVDVAAAVAVPGALGFVATAVEETQPAPPQLHVVPDPEADARARAEAEEALAEAEDAVAQARDDHERAKARVEELRARQLQIESEIDELRRQVAALEETYDEVDDDLGEAEAFGADAADALAVATSERDDARAALDALD